MKTVPNGQIRDGRVHEVIYHVETITPPIPPLEETDGYDLPKKQQKYRRVTLPEGFKALPGKSGREIKDYAPEFQQFIEQEYKRRYNGYWFFNNGMVTYLPGEYYWRLTWWKMDVEMEYRDRDRRKAMYWRHWCYADDGNDRSRLSQKSFGVIYAKGRRDGATADALGKCYELASREKRAMVGMQSKDNESARKAFDRLILSWRKLPSFFQPIFDGTTQPKKELRFSEPPEKGKNAKIRNSSALDSAIDFKSTTSTAYDGEKLKFYYGDEWGKVEDPSIRVTKTWNVVRPCLAQGGNRIIVGKAYITSTVEDMEKGGGAEFKKLWDGSDPRQMHVSGRTATGLCRLFLNSADGLEGWVDEYGMSVMEDATADQVAYLRGKYPESADDYQIGGGALHYIFSTRKALMEQGRFEDVADYRRKFPIVEEDCFAPSAKLCLFDVVKLDNRLDVLRSNLRPVLRRVNFTWEKNERDTKVAWHDDPNGKWLVGYLFEDSSLANGFEKRGNHFYPLNTDKFCGASDPVDHKNEDGSERRSRFVGSAIRKFDLMQPAGTTYKPVALYQYRPPDPQLAYEDMIMMCVYYGMDLLPEMQKPGLANYFHQRGYGAFIGKRPENTYAPGKAPKKKEDGINASTNVHIQIAEALQSYIYNHCDLIDYEDIITDCREFDINKTTKYDVAMCFGYNLIYANRIMPRKQESGFKVEDYLKVYR